MDLVLSIGGITIAMRRAAGTPWTWHEPVERFLLSPDQAPAADLDLTITLGPPPAREGDDLLFDSRAVWRLFREPNAFRIECTSEAFGAEPYKTAIVDETFSRGTIFVADPALPPLDYPLDEVLVANLLGRGRGVELHSCGIVDREGRGHLFVGVSGAGKSTTARLWGERAAVVVSDDRVIVREVDGEMRMYGTPWHGEAELSSPLHAPLAGVYLLVQASRNEIVRVPPAEAVARLFRCCFPLFYDRAALDFTLSFLQRLVSRVPVRELKFRREPRVVDLVLRGS